MHLVHALLSQNFMPHGTCYLWRPSVLWLNVISDGVIAASYYAIPLLLIEFTRRRRDLAFQWIFVAFATFILACGSMHSLAVWTVRRTDYAAERAVKAVAAASLLAAVQLWPLLQREPTQRLRAEAMLLPTRGIARDSMIC